MEIDPVVFHQDEKTRWVGGRPRVTRQAGWVILNNVDGHRMDPIRIWPTREAAEADLPQVVASYQARVEDNERAAAQRAQAAQVPPPAGRRYRTVHSSLYGEGHVYDDQPGATQYDDGSGQFNIQIWDNA